MFWVRKGNVSLTETFLLRDQILCLIEKNTPDNYFWGLYTFMSTSLYFGLQIIRNKISSPKDFEFTRFDCM